MRGQPIAPPPGLWRTVCIQNVPVVGPIKLQQRFMGFNEDGLPACHTGEVKSKSQKKKVVEFICVLYSSRIQLIKSITFSHYIFVQTNQ